MTNPDRTNFAAMRIIIVLNALWLVLSRPDLPRFASLPVVFFKQIPRITTIRFAAFHFPAAIEWTLYIALIASLIAVAFDIRTQFTAFAAALLLYRFAALEPLIGSISSLWFTCYTHLILGLIFIAIARKDERWPVTAFRTLFALYYFFCGWAKLLAAGLHWATAANLRASILAQETRYIFHTPWAATVASSNALCLTLAISTLLLELLFPIVLISRRARAIIVPATLLGHLGIALTMGLLFLNWPLLFIYVDWAAVRERIQPGATIPSIA